MRRRPKRTGTSGQRAGPGLNVLVDHRRAHREQLANTGRPGGMGRSSMRRGAVWRRRRKRSCGHCAQRPGTRPAHRRRSGPGKHRSAIGRGALGWRPEWGLAARSRGPTPAATRPHPTPTGEATWPRISTRSGTATRPPTSASMPCRDPSRRTLLQGAGRCRAGAAAGPGGLRQPGGEPRPAPGLQVSAARQW